MNFSPRADNPTTREGFDHRWAGEILILDFSLDFILAKGPPYLKKEFNFLWTYFEFLLLQLGTRLSPKKYFWLGNS